MPPRGCNAEREPVQEVAASLAGVTVADNPMAATRASSIVYGSKIRDTLGVEVVPNLSCRDRNLLALKSEMLGAHMLGFRSLFLVTGDTPRVRDGFNGVWEVSSMELCRLIKRSAGEANLRSRLDGIPDFNLGGAIVFGRPDEAETYKSKLDSGFDFFISQITYSPQQVIDFFAETERRGILHPKPIQIGFSPASSYRKLRRTASMPGVEVPEKTLRYLEKLSDFGEGIVSYLSEVADEIRQSLPGVSLGFHVMPLGSEELGVRLVKELK